MMADAEALHPVAQEFAVAIIAHLAEDAGFQPEHAGPAEMVEDDAADRRLFDRVARAVGIENNFFVGLDDARSAIEQVHHHTAATDHIELRINH